MRIYLSIGFITLFAACALMARAQAAQQQDAGPARAVVADFKNTSRDRHEITAQATTQEVAIELQKRGIYDVVPRADLDRTARARGLRPPYQANELTAVAHDLGATVVVSGEVKDVGESRHNRDRTIEVGLIIRAMGVDSDELENGAALRIAITVDKGTPKTDGELLVQVATLAADKAVGRMEGYKPISGTILSPIAFGSIVLNRGVGDGVKVRQVFTVYRDGGVVGHVRASTVSDSYTELIVLDDLRGIRPQDKAVSIFPEPRLPELSHWR